MMLGRLALSLLALSAVAAGGSAAPGSSADAANQPPPAASRGRRRRPLMFRAPLPVRVALAGFGAESMAAAVAPSSSPGGSAAAAALAAAVRVDPEEVLALLERALPTHTPSVVGEAARAPRPLALEYELRYGASSLVALSSHRRTPCGGASGRRRRRRRQVRITRAGA